MSCLRLTCVYVTQSINTMLALHLQVAGEVGAVGVALEVAVEDLVTVVVGEAEVDLVEEAVVVSVTAEVVVDSVEAPEEGDMVTAATEAEEGRFNNYSKPVWKTRCQVCWIRFDPSVHGMAFKQPTESLEFP